MMVVFFPLATFKFPFIKNNTVVIYNNNFATSWRLFAGESEAISNIIHQK